MLILGESTSGISNNKFYLMRQKIASTSSVLDAVGDKTASNNHIYRCGCGQNRINKSEY